MRVVVEVLEIAAMTVAGAAALGGIAWLVVRQRRRAAQSVSADSYRVTVARRAARRLAARTEAAGWTLRQCGPNWTRRSHKTCTCICTG